MTFGLRVLLNQFPKFIFDLGTEVGVINSLVSITAGAVVACGQNQVDAFQNRLGGMSNQIEQSFPRWRASICFADLPVFHLQFHAKDITAVWKCVKTAFLLGTFGIYSESLHGILYFVRVHIFFWIIE